MMDMLGLPPAMSAQVQRHGGPYADNRVQYNPMHPQNITQRCAAVPIVKCASRTTASAILLQQPLRSY